LLKIIEVLRKNPIAKEAVHALLMEQMGRGDSRASGNLRQSEPTSSEILQRLKLPSGHALFDVRDKADVIETEDMRRAHHAMKRAILSHTNLVMIGDVGTGKTIIQLAFRDVIAKNDKIVIASPPSILYHGRFGVSTFYRDIILALKKDHLVEPGGSRLHLESELRKILTAAPEVNVALMVDDAHLVREDAVHDILTFQRSLKIKNLSIILTGSPRPQLKNLPSCKTLKLQGLRPDEIAQYIELASRRSGGVLPEKAPAAIFKDPGFFDVRDAYLKFVWASKAQTGVFAERKEG
jgi:type II secretory pathway predicted ATPase ExeA